jgi:hypothetical protein
MSRYKTFQAGDWVQPIREGYRAKCCDCGLVHKINFRIYRGKIQFQVFRDEKATANSRRAK